MDLLLELIISYTISYLLVGTSRYKNSRSYRIMRDSDEKRKIEKTYDKNEEEKNTLSEDTLSEAYCPYT